MEEEKFYTIILRHDDSTKWMINDPILALGEYGVEDDTHRIKRGDGKTKWSEIEYEHFGLEYLITYSNLRGEVSDNLALQNALDAKVDKEIFEDIQNTIISGLTITTEEGKIGRITKTTKDVVNGTVKLNQLLIQSTDQSVQGIWSIDEEGLEILDLRANEAIDDYEPQRYYFKDQICFYNNVLYRALGDFEAGAILDPNQWVILASLHSDDIRYDNKISGLESRTVKTAIDELKDLTDEKLQMTRRPYKVYGTNEDGEQMLYDKDDLRTVDSVNGIEATPETKNIQIDAKGINYDDEAEVVKTIKEVLDSKVDKVVAGEGAKIVRDVKIGYDESTGHVKLVEDKLSLEDGTSETETSEVNVVSNTELNIVSQNLQTNIDNVKASLDEKINNEVEQLNKTIESNDQAINTRVSDLDYSVNTRITKEVSTLNQTIEINKTDIEEKLATAKAELKRNIDINDNEINARVTNEVKTLNNRIDTEVETLNATISDNKTDIETKLANEVKTLNETITTKETDINTRIDNEVATLNTTISDNHTEINDKVDVNKADIEAKLEAGLNTKIDKTIADSIITGIFVDTEPGEKLDEPTLKIVAKNTDTKTELFKHIHFAEKGSINITKENDHIVIDSRDIDLQVANNKAAIEANDLEINALQEHDVAHDTELALHSSQLANHETRMLQAEADIVRLDKEVDDLDAKIENEITNRKVEDAKLETDISRNALNIQANAEAIRENADNIIELNNVLQENVTNLANSKADKAFAKDTDNKVVGKVTLNTLETGEIADMTVTSVSPVDGTSSVENIKLVSTDNTLVSKAVLDENGNIIAYDLATNLDTDVNYWITTEIISTNIPSETVLDITKLTSTTKTPIELQDIVSDPEGTWARVQEIDNEANTITVVTFHKHAQAVWGTVKGDITDQADLQAELDKKIDESIAANVITGIRISDTGSNKDNLDNIKFSWEIKPTNGSGGYTAQGGVFAKSDSILLTKGTGTNPTTYRFKVEAEGVAFNAEESGLTSTMLAPAIRELKTLDDAKVKITDFETFKTEAETIYIKKEQITNHVNGDGSNRSVIDMLNPSKGTAAGFTFHRALIDGTRADGGYYFNYLIDAPDADLTFTYEDKGSVGAGYSNIYHHMKVNAENILIDTTNTTLTETKLGAVIRELDTKLESGVKTVNGISVDANNNIALASQAIPYDNSLVSTEYVDNSADEVQTMLTSLVKEVESLKQVQTWTNQVYNLDELLKDIPTYTTKAPIKLGDYVSAEGGDEVILLAKINDLNTFLSTNFAMFGNGYLVMKSLVENATVSLVGIPEQCTEPPTLLNIKLNLDDYVTANYAGTYQFGIIKLPVGTDTNNGKDTYTMIPDYVFEFKEGSVQVPYDPATDDIYMIIVDPATGIMAADTSDVGFKFTAVDSDYQLTLSYYYQEPKEA